MQQESRVTHLIRITPKELRPTSSQDVGGPGSPAKTDLHLQTHGTAITHPGKMNLGRGNQRTGYMSTACRDYA